MLNKPKLIKLTLFVFVIIALLLYGCTSQKNVQQNQEVRQLEPQSVSECNQKNDLWCFSTSFGNQGNSESCTDTKDSCLSGRAGELKDASICETIKTSEDKDDCYSNVAGRTNNLALCEKPIATDKKSKCIGNVAGVRGDSNLCNDAVSKDDCYLGYSMSNPKKKKTKKNIFNKKRNKKQKKQ